MMKKKSKTLSQQQPQKAFADEDCMKRIGVALMAPIREAMTKNTLTDEINRILPPIVIPRGMLLNDDD